MKMTWFLILFLAGLGVCGVIVHRHYRRITPAPHAETLRPVDRWQRNIRLAPPGGYTTGQQRLLEKLRREEERQRPQEGRN